MNAGSLNEFDPEGAEVVRRNPARRFALLGLFGAGNLGNDGSLEAMLGFLRRARPAAELFCVCRDPNFVTDRYGVQATSLRWKGVVRGLPRRPHGLFQKARSRGVDLAFAVRTLRGVEVMVVPGTGIHDDFGDHPGGMPFVAARIAGTRFADYDDILCVECGDDDPPEKDLIRVVVDGIRAADPHALHTSHGSPGNSEASRPVDGLADFTSPGGNVAGFGDSVLLTRSAAHAGADDSLRSEVAP